MFELGGVFDKEGNLEFVPVVEDERKAGEGIWFGFFFIGFFIFLRTPQHFEFYFVVEAEARKDGVVVGESVDEEVVANLEEGIGLGRMVLFNFQHWILLKSDQTLCLKGGILDFSNLGFRKDS